MRTSVGVRVRPLSNDDVGTAIKIYQEQNAIAQVNEEGQLMEQQLFAFDRVFDTQCNTQEVYEECGRHIVEGFLKGINGTVFAYGATSSGKSFTMMGGPKQGERGILDMAAETIFSNLASTASIKVSFVEVYNEVIRDLINEGTSASSSVQIRGNRVCSTEIECKDHETIVTTLKRGLAKRAVEATAMNEKSSRSHSIFTLSLTNRLEDGTVLKADLNLVDLAGSESVKHTGASGQRQKEGAKINQSLLSLSKVIHALSQHDKSGNTHISYRDSKLTRLLQPSLSGEAQMSVICCVTPSAKFIEQTLCTLQFASRCALVTTCPVINQVETPAASVMRLQKEIEALKEENAAGYSNTMEVESLRNTVKQQEEVIARYQKQLGAAVAAQTQTRGIGKAIVMMRDRSGTAAAIESTTSDGDSDEDDGDTVPLGAMVAGTLSIPEGTESTDDLVEKVRWLESKVFDQEGALATLTETKIRLEGELHSLGTKTTASKGGTETSPCSEMDVDPPSIEVVIEMQAKITSLEQELTDGEMLLTSIEQENEMLRKDLEDAHNNAQDLDDERREGRVQIAALERELESAIVDLGEVSEQAKEVTILRASLASEKKGHEASLSLLAVNEMKVTAALEQLEKQQREMENSSNTKIEVDTQAKRLQQLQTQVDLLQQENDRLGLKNEALEDNLKQATRREESLQKQLEESQTTVNKIKQKNSHSQALTARVASLETSLDEARTKLSVSEDGERRLQSQLNDIQEGLNKHTCCATTTVEGLNGLDNAKKDDTIAVLQLDLSESQQRLIKCQEELALVKSECDKAYDTNMKLQEALDSVPPTPPNPTPEFSEREKKAERDAAMRAAEVMELEEEVAGLKKEIEILNRKGMDTSTVSETPETCMKADVSPVPPLAFDKDTLVGEMNALMEMKTEFESRATAAEDKVQGLTITLNLMEEQLNQHRLKVEVSVETIRGKEAEIVEVRSEVAATRDALIDSQKHVKKLEKRVETLEQDASKQDDYVTEVENELFTLRQAAEAASTEEPTQQLALAAEVKELREDCKAKDARIEKLEKSKLTRENLDKIKAIKEEKTRLAKENKKLNRQLEEMNNSARGTSSSNKELSSLQVQLDDRNSQLQEYEAERQSVLRVLEEHGVDANKLTDSGLNLDASLDHTDLDISATLIRVLKDLKKKTYVPDIDELRSLEEENVALLKENRTLRRQIDREKRQSLSTSIQKTPQTEDKENRPISFKRSLDVDESLDKSRSTIKRSRDRVRGHALTEKA